jgi:hypothetical protein
MFIKITPGFCNSFRGIRESIPQAKLSHGISDFLAKHQKYFQTFRPPSDPIILSLQASVAAAKCHKPDKESL